MADLRLVGVHDDGGHLLLSGPGGEIFLLPIDEALRLATTRSPRRAAPGANAPGRMSPREIQAQIRGGATAADVAEHSGMSLEQVRRYEGPVLAEREHVAQMARKVEVSSSTPGSDGYRSAFGDNPASLDEMVMHRLSAFGIDPRTVRWDAWRVHDGTWTVTADFEPGNERAANSIGESAPARWTFHTGRKSLHNANRWAQQLSEMEPVDGPVPERRLSAVADRPFDFEADTSGEESPESSEGAGDALEGAAGGGLLDMLRSRRGRRLGLDEDGDDELAAMLGTHVPAAHPRDGEDDPGSLVPGPKVSGNGVPGTAGDSGSDGPGTDGLGGGDTAPGILAAGESGPPAQDGEDAVVAPADETGHELPASASAHGKKRLRAIPFLSLAPRLNGQDEEEDAVGVGEVSTDTREITLSGAPSLRRSAREHGVDTTTDQPPVATSPAADQAAAPASGGPAEAGPSDSEVAARLERKAAGKPKRSSVPSWDEIVFGTKGD